MGFADASRWMLLAPVRPTGNESYRHLLGRERANGYARVRIDGGVFSLDEPVDIDTRREHTVELVVDRVVIGSGVSRPPEPWEMGWKDTVIAYPGEITRVKALFDIPGLYVWHCHILSHEDNEMMVPYCVGERGVDCPEELF